MKLNWLDWLWCLFAVVTIVFAIVGDGKVHWLWALGTLVLFLVVVHQSRTNEAMLEDVRDILSMLDARKKK
jgi:hypothetical protein